MSKTMGQLATGLILAILSATLGVLGERYRTGEETKTRYLDYRIDQQPVDLPAVLQITLEGKRVDNLSWVAIDIYNLSDRDFEGVPPYIDLVPRAERTVSIISSFVVGPRNTPGVFQEIKGTPSLPSGTTRIGYHVEAMNRLSSPVFRASFFLRGEIPDVHIFTMKTGLELRPIDMRMECERPSAVAVIFPVLLMLGLLVGVAVLVARLERRQALKRDEELRDRLTRSLADGEAREALKLGAEVDTSGLAGHFVRTLQRFRWERVPRIFRVFSSFPPPPELESTRTERPDR